MLLSLVSMDFYNYLDIMARLNNDLKSLYDCLKQEQ